MRHAMRGVSTPITPFFLRVYGCRWGVCIPQACSGQDVLDAVVPPIAQGDMRYICGDVSPHTAHHTVAPGRTTQGMGL